MRPEKQFFFNEFKFSVAKVFSSSVVKALKLNFGNFISSGLFVMGKFIVNGKVKFNER